MQAKADSVAPDWELLEQLVASIQKQLSPHALVRHNVLLDGVDSEIKRQIDVLVEQQIGQYKMRIVIDCKDYAKPIDLKGVEEFHGLVQDVRAHKGALVCPSGFTKAALKRARKLQIELYKPISTQNHKWQMNVKAPVLCDFRDALMSFGIRCSDPKPILLPSDFYTLPVQNRHGKCLGTSLAAAQALWNNGLLPDAPGHHEHVSIFRDEKVYIDNGNSDTIEVTLTVGIFVTSNLYLGELPIEEIEGLQNEATGEVVTNAFTVGGLDPQKVETSWARVESAEILEVTPLLRVVGYNYYGVET